MRTLPWIMLAAAFSVSITPNLAARGSQPASTPSRSHPTAAAKARDKAQLAFQRDLVSVLAPRADAAPLLAAALLARPLFNQPPANSFHTLIHRAAQADGAGEAEQWLRLADCDAKADACPDAAALDRLVAQAPDNAAVWLMKLGADTRSLKPEEARTDLSRAAAAKRYDDYAGASLQALANHVSVLPAPAAAMDQAATNTPAALPLMLTFSLGAAQPQPGMPLVAQLCEKSTQDASIRTDCLALAKLLEWGSSPLARSLGLHLEEVLVDDPAQQQDARRARTDLIWQVQQFGQLLQKARTDQVLAQHLLALASHGGSEMSLLLAALRDSQIAASAPTGWAPAKPAG